MARISVTIQYPTADASDSVAVLQSPTTTALNATNGMTIPNAFAVKDNTLTLVISNTANAQGTLTLKAGFYPNAMLGDLQTNIPASSTAVLKIENPSRFEKADGSLDLDLSTGFTGTIYAFAKKAGLV